MQGANGKDHFIFVTNLAPCTGVRIHLWPEKGKSTTDLPGSKRILEVTSKMVHIPSRAAPRQVLNVVILQRSKLMFYWYGESNIIPFGQCDWHFPPKYVVLLISLNLAVRQSKRLHLLYFSLVLRICVVSDSWLFQLLLLQYWLLSASWSFPFSNHHLTCIRIVFNPFFFFILRIGDGLHRKKQINKNAYALTYSHNHTHTHTHREGWIWNYGLSPCWSLFTPFNF